MSYTFASELGLIRKLAGFLERRATPKSELSQKWLEHEGLGRVYQRGPILFAIRDPGHIFFQDLMERLLVRMPAMARGVSYCDVEEELETWLVQYVDCEEPTISKVDAEALVRHFEIWYCRRCASRRIFVACALSPYRSDQFAIGPVAFQFTADVERSTFLPLGADAVLDRPGIDSFVRWMKEQKADWMAQVVVEGCEQKRAEEIADLATDLAIVSIQLSAPNLETRTMARIVARRGGWEQRTLSETGGLHKAGWRRKEPGSVIGEGTMQELLRRRAPVFVAVGNIIRSFASGSYRLPSLEQAWCDAAYWYHEAIAERIDAIAMAKLETALEVLACGEGSKGSTRRILQILNAFFGLQPTNPIRPGSSLLARDFAQKVVGDRSRVLHGTWSTLNKRGFDRGGMEAFVGSTLRGAVTELEAYASNEHRNDNIDDFLTWVSRRRE